MPALMNTYTKKVSARLALSSRVKVSCVCEARNSARATTNRYSSNRMSEAQQAEFLADHGEDEVGVPLGQVFQL